MIGYAVDTKLMQKNAFFFLKGLIRGISYQFLSPHSCNLSPLHELFIRNESLCMLDGPYVNVHNNATMYPLGQITGIDHILQTEMKRA